MKKTSPCRSIFLFVFATLSLYATVAGSAKASDESVGQPFIWKDGAQIYASICGHCHETGVGPPIRQRSLPPEYIAAVVRNGHRAMPAFRLSEIDDMSLAKLAEFIAKSKATP